MVEWMTEVHSGNRHGRQIAGFIIDKAGIPSLLFALGNHRR